MKKLHLTAGNDELRPIISLIVVQNNFVYSTNAHVIVKFPVKEIFGNAELIAENETLAFRSKDWKKASIFKASYFTREGMIFKAFDHKSNLLGMIEAIDQYGIDKLGRIPYYDSVFPDDSKPECQDKLCINPEYFYNVWEAFGIHETALCMTFTGINRGIVLRDKSGSSEGIGLIMPIMTTNV